jgi:hypothetical protein
MTPRRLRARQPRLTPVLRAACHAILIGYDVAPGLVDMSEFVDLVGTVGIKTSGRWIGTATGMTGTSIGGTRTAAMGRGIPAERIRIYVVGIHNDYLACVRLGRR